MAWRGRILGTLAAILVAGCGGGGGAGDPGGPADPGAADLAGADLPAIPDAGDRDAVRDVPAEDPGALPDVPADVPAQDPGAADPGVADPGPSDPGPGDPGPADPGASDPGIDPTGWLLPPAVQCPAPADACALPAPVAGAAPVATYRKDYYLKDTEYNEYTDYPIAGGRFQVAAVSAVTGTVTGVTLDGADVDTLLVKPRMEWYHVWPRKVVAGEPVWFAFHSKDGAWDTAKKAALVIRTDAGDAVNGSFAVAPTKVPLTYVTTTDDLSAFVIHVRNADAAAQVVTGLEVNGREVLQTGVACVPRTTIPPGDVAMWTVPTCGAIVPGSAWTVVARFADSPPSVGAGRVHRPFFPIETWPSSSDCPYPTAEAGNWEKHVRAGFDTYFTRWSGYGDNCRGFSTQALAETDFPALGDQFLLLDGESNGPTLSTTAGLAGIMTGDESDGEVWDGSDKPNAAAKAALARASWDRYPDVPVYNGAKTNGNVGAFAGMADIQGMDFYNAACAPHITAWGKAPPIDGPYDYLRNARNNHMPLPTWLYAQGLGTMWNFVPDATEATHAAFSVMAAGGKGLMWFQSNMGEADANPGTWDAMSKANFTFRAVRRYLREGDVTGMARADMTAIVESIRARDAIVLVVLDADVQTAPTDVGCAGSGIGLKPHFALRNIQPVLSVAIPDDFGLREIFEVRDGAVWNVTYAPTFAGRILRLGPVPLSNADPARVFVLAGAEGVRQAVAAAGVKTVP